MVWQADRRHELLQLLGLTYLVMVLASRTPVWGRLAMAGALLAAYFASGLLAIALTRSWHVATASGAVTAAVAILDALGRRAGPVGAGWIYTGGLVMLWWLVSLGQYRARVFVRV